MSIDHFDVMAKYTDYCENRQNWKSAIKLVWINILISLKLLYFIFFNVWENKVPLEFWFS